MIIPVPMLANDDTLVYGVPAYSITPFAPILVPVDVALSGPPGDLRNVAPQTSLQLTVNATAPDGYDLDGQSVTLRDETSPVSEDNLNQQAATFTVTPAIGAHSYSASMDVWVASGQAPFATAHQVASAQGADGSTYYYLPNRVVIATVPPGGVLTPAQSSTLGEYTPNLVHYVSAANSLDVTVPKIATTLSIALTSQNNRSFTFTPTVTPDFNFPDAPTGSVSLYDNGQFLAASNLPNPMEVTLPAGAHSFTASYAGDGQYLGASTATALLRTLSVTALTASPKPSVDNAITLTASVAPDIGGTVRFFDGSTLLGTAAAENGAATLTVNILAAGPHDLSAQFDPTDAGTLASTGTLALDVANHTVIDLLALVTPQATSAAADLHARIAQGVADANAAFVQNHVPVTIHLVAIVAEAYAESGSVTTDLAHLTVIDGTLDNVNALRRMTGADLVALFDGSASGAAPFAATGFAQPNAGGQAENAFMVIQQAALASGALTHAIDFTLGAAAGDSATAAANAAIVAAYRSSTPYLTLEAESYHHMNGWIIDPASPNTAATVQVSVDGRAIATFTANLRRDDVDAQYGDGPDHGFAFTMPVLPEGDHTVTFAEIDPATGAAIAVPYADQLISSPSPLFDEIYYLQHNPDVVAAIDATQIAGNVQSPPDLDPQLHLSAAIRTALVVDNTPGIGGGGNQLTAWLHFKLAGQFEGRNPSAYFDNQYYLAQNPDVAAAYADHAVASLFEHYSTTGQFEDRTASPYFDPHFYRLANPDVNAAILKNSNLSAIGHFLLAGQSENRDPIAYFDAGQYEGGSVTATPGAPAALPAYTSFLALGNAAGLNPSTWFDEATYLALNPDVAAAVNNHTLVSGLDHYLREGQKEGRQFSRTFSESAYLADNPNVAAAVRAGEFTSGFEQYILVGRFKAGGV